MGRQSPSDTSFTTTISLRVPIGLLDEVKRQAPIFGMPYQTFLKALIQQGLFYLEQEGTLTMAVASLDEERALRAQARAAKVEAAKATVLLEEEAQAAAEGRPAQGQRPRITGQATAPKMDTSRLRALIARGDDAIPDAVNTPSEEGVYTAPPIEPSPLRPRAKRKERKIPESLQRAMDKAIEEVRNPPPPEGSLAPTIIVRPETLESKVKHTLEPTKTNGVHPHPATAHEPEEVTPGETSITLEEIEAMLTGDSEVKAEALVVRAPKVMSEEEAIVSDLADAIDSEGAGDPPSIVEPLAASPAPDQEPVEVSDLDLSELLAQL